MWWPLGGHWGGHWVAIGWPLGGHWVAIGVVIGWSLGGHWVDKSSHKSLRIYPLAGALRGGLPVSHWSEGKHTAARARTPPHRFAAVLSSFGTDLLLYQTRLDLRS